MKFVLPYVLFSCFIGALYLTVQVVRKERLKYVENRLYLHLCIFSTIWGFGFWCVNIQTDPDMAYIFRMIAMLGVFSYLIIIQLLICRLSEVSKRYYYAIAAVAAFGYVICFFVTRKDSVIYELTDVGMVYSFQMDTWNIVYVVYCVVIAVNVFTSIWHMMTHATRRRNVVLAQRFMLVEGVIVVGMVLDTVFPLFGINAVPGSTIGQFIGLLAVASASKFINRYRITADNMSTYVYGSLTTPVLVYDSDYEAQIINDAAHMFLKFQGAEEDAGVETLFSVKPEEVFHYDGERKDIDVTCNPNGLPCSLSVSKIRDDYGDVIGYIIIVTDLSERVNAMASLEHAMSEAKSANQAKTTFLANMSHEIRTPMNAIIGFAELVLRDDINDKVRGYVEGISLSAKNLLAIINDILDITKIETGKVEIVPEQYYVADLLEDVSLIISQQAGKKNLAFVMKADDNIPSRMYGDKVHIRGILINLLNNAVKYTKAGTVTFETKVVSRRGDDITLAFVVSDTGVGIRREDIGKLFQNFERLGQELHYGVEGSGLGLAISKNYATMMGGDISVESEYGVGSVFTFVLAQKITDHTPMASNFSIDRHTKEETSACKITIRDTRVLLVDDNAINLTVTKALLNTYGLAVDTALSGRIAIEACRGVHYPIVFMDQMMPEMDGIEAMREIRKLDDFYRTGGECRMIVLTANAIRGSREQLMKDGFDEYLGKPLNLKQLERLLIRYIPADKLTITTTETAAGGGTAEADEGEDIRYLQNHLGDVDISMGLKNCGGKVADYLKILKINYTYGGRHLKEMREMLEGKDYENYTIKIHAMKSTTKGFGAVTLSNLAYEQEMAGKAGSYSFIDEHFEPFCTEYEKQLRRIGDVLRHYGVISDENGGESGGDGAEAFDGRMLPNVLSNIKRRVDEFDFAGVFEVLDELKKYRLTDEQSNLFAKIASLMDELSVDEVKKLIDENLGDEDVGESDEN